MTRTRSSSAAFGTAVRCASSSAPGFLCGVSADGNMWLEWISDESRLAVTDEEHEKIVKLYERGVADYSMPRLWESYVQYSQKRYAEREDGDAAKPKLLNDARLVAERALACVGTHFTEGQRIWELQRSFEIGILEALGSEDNMQSLRVRPAFDTDCDAWPRH